MASSRQLLCLLGLLVFVGGSMAAINPSSARILVIRRDSNANSFSAEYPSNTAQATGLLSTLPRTYAGTYSGVEIYNASSLATRSSEARETATTLCEKIKAENPDVSICEVDLQVGSDATKPSPVWAPNDPLMPEQWGMPMIKAQGAWLTTAGSAKVRVCMVDTGVDYYHPDILKNLWQNPGEASFGLNGLDNDHDGIINDIYGANFVDGQTSGDPYDDNGHGTFVTGVVGAVGNNGIGVSGVSQVVSIVSCKFMDENGNGYVSDAIRCFDYCLAKGAHVLSNSWGGVAYSQALKAAVDRIEQRGVLFVASAGNDGVNTDTAPHYPSSLPNANILAVAAVDSTGAFWSQSNRGLKTVHLAAPGVRVLNLGIGGSYLSMTGTSMATPHVAGTAALVLAQFLALAQSISTTFPSVGRAAAVRQIIISQTLHLPGPKVIAYGLLNAKGAVLQVAPYLKAQAAAAKGTASAGTGGSAEGSTSGDQIFIPSQPLYLVPAPGLSVGPLAPPAQEGIIESGKLSARGPAAAPAAGPAAAASPAGTSAELPTVPYIIGRRRLRGGVSVKVPMYRRTL